MEKDIRYKILEDEYQDIITFKKGTYRNCEWQLNANGFNKAIVNGFEVYLYNSYLTELLFEGKNIKVENLETKENLKLDVTSYFNVFIDGYKEGIEYFNQNYKVNSTIIYNIENCKFYKNNLHQIVCHLDDSRNDAIGRKGWKTIKEVHPLIFTSKNFERYGFYMGLIHNIELLRKQHKILFHNIYNCTDEHKIDIDSKIEKHLDFLQKNCPRKHKKILDENDFKTLISCVKYYYNNDYKIPEIHNPIRIVNTNKTSIQISFKLLYKEIYPSSPYPKNLFDLYVKIFSKYKTDKRNNFIKVNMLGSDEIKKLMKIK